MSVSSGSRQLLIHGLVLVLVGLVWGLIVPGRLEERGWIDIKGQEFIQVYLLKGRR